MRYAGLAVAGTAFILVSCATVAKATLEDRFQKIGIPEDTAVCMANDLDERLSDEDLSDLARYTVSLTRADTTEKAIKALSRIDNPRAVTAIAASAISCIGGFRP